MIDTKLYRNLNT